MSLRVFHIIFIALCIALLSAVLASSPLLRAPSAIRRFDAEMERMDQEYQARRAEQTNNSPLHQKLRAAGKAP